MISMRVLARSLATNIMATISRAARGIGARSRTTLSFVHEAKIPENWRKLRIVCAQYFFLDRERAFEQRFGFAKPFLGPIQIGQVAQDVSQVGMVLAK
jgi:hypothetical protein